MNIDYLRIKTNCTDPVKTVNRKRTSYGRIKETTIGGIFIHRSYRHIKDYKKYLNLKIATDTSGDRKKIGFIKEKTKGLVKRDNRIQCQIAEGKPQIGTYAHRFILTWCKLYFITY